MQGLDGQGKCPIHQGQGKSGKLAMVMGKYHFCYVGQGNGGISIVTKVFDLFILHLKFMY